MDKLPSIPFTLRLPSPKDRVNLETVVNEVTNEKFSVSHDDGMIEIRRTRAPKKKGKISQT